MISQQSSIRIRPARHGDIEAISLIYSQAVEDGGCTAHLHPPGEVFFRDWFEGHDPGHYPVYVILGEECVAGWLSISPYRMGREALDHVAEVSYYVHRDHRGKGLGSRLLRHAIGRCPALGIEVLVAILLGINHSSIGMLEKHGFESWAALPGIARISGLEVDHLYYGLKLA